MPPSGEIQIRLLDLKPVRRMFASAGVLAQEVERYLDAHATSEDAELRTLASALVQHKATVARSIGSPSRGRNEAS